MIELDGNDRPTLGTKRELRDLLTPYFGRLIRVSYIPTKPWEVTVLKQRTGYLEELSYTAVHDGEPTRDGEIVLNDDSSELKFRLRGESPADEFLIADSDTIELFQEDLGSWKFLHITARMAELLENGFEL